jgi:hypothetical protein
VVVAIAEGVECGEPVAVCAAEAWAAVVDVVAADALQVVVITQPGNSFLKK